MKTDFDDGKLFVARMVRCDWRTIICVCGPGLSVLLLFLLFSSFGGVVPTRYSGWL